MKKNSVPKIVALTFTIALITGMIGGAFTNEYLIAYLFGQLTEMQEEEFPIVKKVIEEKVYVEESSTLEAIEEASKALVLISDTQTPSSVNKAINSDFYYKGYSPQKIDNPSQTLAGSGFVLTSDGVIATCSSLVKNRNSWFVIFDNDQVYNAQVVYRDDTDDIALLKISDNAEFEYFNTLEFNDQPINAGQKALSLGAFNKAKSGIISSVQDDSLRDFPGGFIQVDFEIDSGLSCGPLINLGGKLVGMTLDFDTEEQGTSYVIPVSAFSSALDKFRTTLQ